MRLIGAGLAAGNLIGDQPAGVFQMASVGKQFVASAVLMLVREGKLDPHEPVSRWLSVSSGEAVLRAPAASA